MVKVTDTPGLLALEDKGAALDLSQRILPEWLQVPLIIIGPTDMHRLGRMFADTIGPGR